MRGSSFSRCSTLDAAVEAVRTERIVAFLGRVEVLKTPSATLDAGCWSNRGRSVDLVD